MNRNIRRSGLLTLMMALGLVVISGCMPRGPFGPGHVRDMLGGKLGSMIDDLEPTAEQRALLLPIKEEIIELAVAAHIARVKMGEKVAEQMATDAPDLDALKALADERAERVRQAGHKFAELVVAAHLILTPAQRDIMREKLDKLRGYFIAE